MNKTIFLFFILFLTITSIYSQESFKNSTEENRNLISLDDKEQQWIREHPVVTYSEVNWKPLSIIKNHTMHGIMRDYLDIISKKTGIVFKYIASDSWQDVLEKFKKDEIDMIPGVGSSSKELALGSVSLSYASYPMVIITDNRYNFVDSLDKFKDKTISVPKYYTSYNFIIENYPNIKLLTTDSIASALLNVETGKADAFVGHIATSLYYIVHIGSVNLKVSGTTKFNFEHHYLIQDKYKELTSIINKAIASISVYEKNTINTNWIKTKMDEKIDYSIFYKFLAITVLIIFIFIWKHYTLKKYNNKLEELKERMDLALRGNNDVIWDYNLKTNELYVSDKWKEITGISKSDISYSADEWKKHIHPDDIKDTIKALNNNIFAKTKYLNLVYRLKHKDGHWLWIQMRGKTYYDKNKKAIRMSGTHTDITAKKELELKVTQQAQMIEQIHDSIIATDLDGKIITWNRGSELLLDYATDEMIGEHITKIYLEEDYDDLAKNIDILKRDGSREAVVRLVRKTGEIIFAELSLSLLRDEKDEVNALVGYCRDITDRKKAEEILLKQKDMLYHQAYHDPLTGLPNRALFIDRLEHGMLQAKREKKRLALFFIDLDRFKQINDSLGHDIGDDVLNIVTKRLNKTIREDDTLARLGGDEFTIIMGDLKHSQDASFLAEKILKVLQDPITIKNHTLYVSSSIGISIYPKDDTNYINLIKYADAAMYRAKDEGRNNYQFYSQEMTELAFERVVMESSIRQALKKDEFEVYYQPQIDAEKNILIGMEALIRWNHPAMGLVYPAKFISLAEDTGLIVDIDLLVMKIAMKQVSQWYKDGFKPGVLSLNLAAKQLDNVDFIPYIKNLMQEFDFKPQWLELEITEGDVMKNPEDAIIKLNEISDLNISIAVDDFGVGYSSLSYLKRFPITKLKIDRTFVRNIPKDEEDSAIIKAIIALGRTLNLKLIAEGVETNEQKDFLLRSRCSNIQGYLYSQAIPANEMKEYLALRL